MSIYRAVAVEGETSRTFVDTSVSSGEWKSFTEMLFGIGSAYAYSVMGQELEPSLFTDTAYTAARGLRKVWSGTKVSGPENKELGVLRDAMCGWAEKARDVPDMCGRKDTDWFNTQADQLALKLYATERPDEMEIPDVFISTLSRKARNNGLGLVVFLADTDREPVNGTYMNIGALFSKLKDYLSGNYYRKELTDLEKTVRKQNRFDDEVERLADSAFAGGRSCDRAIFLEDLKEKADSILMDQLCIMSMIAVIIRFGTRSTRAGTDLVINNDVREYLLVRSGMERVHLVIDSSASAVSCAYLSNRSFDPVYCHRSELKDGMVMYSDGGMKVYLVRYLSSIAATIGWIGERVRMMLDTVVISDTVAIDMDDDEMRENVRACIGHEVIIRRAAVKDSPHSNHVDLYLDANCGTVQRSECKTMDLAKVPEILHSETAYSEEREKDM